MAVSSRGRKKREKEQSRRGLRFWRNGFEVAGWVVMAGAFGTLVPLAY
jgi:hypothetical protein